MNHIAAFDAANRARADWLRLSIHLQPHVADLGDYRVRTTKGLVLAELWLSSRPALPLDSQTIAEAHRLTFADSMRSAGAFRPPGQLAVFGPHMGAEPARIPIELARTNAELMELVESASDASDMLVCIAYAHARFIATHPFLDGNGRVGRLLLHHLADTLGLPLNSRLLANERPRYIESLTLALETNNLEPLARLLGEAAGCELEHPKGVPLLSRERIKCRAMLHTGDISSLTEERKRVRLTDSLPFPRPPSETPSAKSARVFSR